MYPLWTYVAYLAASVALTVWVAHTLHKNGRVFLVDAFHGREALADSVNHLLVVGFYLINIGFVTLALKEKVKPTAAVEAVEFFSTKIGYVLLVLGAMHFFNMAVFSVVRKRGLDEPEWSADVVRGNVPHNAAASVVTEPSGQGTP